MTEEKWDEAVSRYIWLRENNHGNFAMIDEALRIERMLYIFGLSLIEHAIKED